jgi:hypothetical protein
MTNIPRWLTRTLLFVGLLTGLTFAVGQEPMGNQTTPAPDDTRQNQRDRDQASATADQQSNAQSDREITQQIRAALVKDKSLSTYAHNVKIITQNGAVTLKGPVRTEEEKRMIESKAAEVSGKDVTNELSVAPKK